MSLDCRNVPPSRHGTRRVADRWHQRLYAPWYGGPWLTLSVVGRILARAALCWLESSLGRPLGAMNSYVIVGQRSLLGRSVWVQCSLSHCKILGRNENGSTTKRHMKSRSKHATRDQESMHRGPAITHTHSQQRTQSATQLRRAHAELLRQDVVGSETMRFGIPRNGLS